MENIKEALAEKKVNWWIRMALRALAWITLCFMVYFKILKPLIKDIEISFNNDDKQVIFWCVALLLAIEVIKKAFDFVIKLKTGNK